MGQTCISPALAAPGILLVLEAKIYLTHFIKKFHYTIKYLH
jgi:hypothetical protein